ncbi:MAG: PDZ domain-containing protein [Acidobacteria bacterium]|nr:PDZ domain-containing protein [Acidobacteriota bacterium]
MISRMLCSLFVALAAVCFAQTTMDQRLADFQQLAATYAKNYGPYEWKLAQGFDLLNIAPWLDRVRRAKDDLEFYDLCIEYVASLNDAHDLFILPSDFSATLGFTVDIYEGKVLIDSINRVRLPVQSFPFVAGDELVSVDGRTVEEWISLLSKYAIAANERSTRRSAAARITNRSQSVQPRAHEIGDTASVVIRRQNGNLETYTISWLKQGTPLLAVGPVPSPKMTTVRAAQSIETPWDDDLPSYLRVLLPLRHVMLAPERQTALNVGGRNPLFAMPQNFTQRLGRVGTDFFFSGIYEAGGFKIGFLRIPNYSQPQTGAALTQFENEIIFFQDNTDGLILDDMRNPGGNACYADSLLQRVIPYKFRTLGFELRATANWVISFSSSVTIARLVGAPEWQIRYLEAVLGDVKGAYSENRGRTGPVFVCTNPILGSVQIDLDPAADRTGKVIAYTKPLMALVDEFSASGGDYFPAVVQDNQRGRIFGMRTMGAGGSVLGFNGATYTEGFARVTVSLMNRKNPIVTPEYPTAPYVENIGVRPDVVEDYMTRENLLGQGRAFVDAFTRAMVDHIRNSQ